MLDWRGHNQFTLIIDKLINRYQHLKFIRRVQYLNTQHTILELEGVELLIIARKWDSEEGTFKLFGIEKLLKELTGFLFFCELVAETFAGLDEAIDGEEREKVWDWQSFEDAVRERKCEERDWRIRVGAEWVGMDLHGEKAGFRLGGDGTENEVLVESVLRDWLFWFYFFCLSWEILFFYLLNPKIYPLNFNATFLFLMPSMMSSTSSNSTEILLSINFLQTFLKKF